MHRVFGTRESAEYIDREGAYLIPACNGKIGVVRTPKGYFFLGGGVESGETHLTCIARECVEEAGYSAVVQGKLCSAESYMKHPELGCFHPVQTYYFGYLTEQVSAPAEEDHLFLWLEYERLKGQMYLEMQNWALEEMYAQVLNK